MATIDERIIILRTKAAAYRDSGDPELIKLAEDIEKRLIDVEKAEMEIEMVVMRLQLELKMEKRRLELELEIKLREVEIMADIPPEPETPEPEEPEVAKHVGR